MEWLPLIFTFLDPMLAQCKNKLSDETPKEYLSQHYNAETGKLSRDVVRRSMPVTKEAIRKALRATPDHEKNNFPRYSRERIYEITEQRLLDAMNANEEQLMAAFSAAEELEG
jgi:hypothetical protein